MKIMTMDVWSVEVCRWIQFKVSISIGPNTRQTLSATNSICGHFLRLHQCSTLLARVWDFNSFLFSVVSNFELIKNICKLRGCYHKRTHESCDAEIPFRFQMNFRTIKNTIFAVGGRDGNTTYFGRHAEFRNQVGTRDVGDIKNWQSWQPKK